MQKESNEAGERGRKRERMNVIKGWKCVFVNGVMEEETDGGEESLQKVQCLCV